MKIKQEKAGCEMWDGVAMVTNLIWWQESWQLQWQCLRSFPSRLSSLFGMAGYLPLPPESQQKWVNDTEWVSVAQHRSQLCSSYIKTRTDKPLHQDYHISLGTMQVWKKCTFPILWYLFQENCCLVYKAQWKTTLYQFRYTNEQEKNCNGILWHDDL